MDDLIADHRERRRRVNEGLRPVAEGETHGGQAGAEPAITIACKAITAQGEGDLEANEIKVKAVNVNGEVTGDEIILKVLP